MKAYFENESRRRQLQIEAQSWIGTPFRAHARIKGAGVDCVNLAGALYVATEFASGFAFPKYSLDRSQHSDRSLVVEFLESWEENGRRFARVPEWRVGDLVCFKFGRCEHHVGIAVGNDQFVHAISGVVVSASSFNDTTWRKRLTAIYRPIHLGRSVRQSMSSGRLSNESAKGEA